MRRIVFFPVLAASFALLGGCGLIYTDVKVPRAWRSATPIDVKAQASDETVSGRSCSHAVLFLVAWGDSGYAAAERKALEGKKDAILYDVHSDVQATALLLGLYTRVCTVVHGRVGRL